MQHITGRNRDRYINRLNRPIEILHPRTIFPVLAGLNLIISRDLILAEHTSQLFQEVFAGLDLFQVLLLACRNHFSILQFAVCLDVIREANFEQEQLRELHQTMLLHIILRDNITNQMSLIKLQNDADLNVYIEQV